MPNASEIPLPVGVVLAEVQEEQGAASYRLVIDTAIVTENWR